MHPSRRHCFCMKLSGSDGSKKAENGRFDPAKLAEIGKIGAKMPFFKNRHTDEKSVGRFFDCVSI